MSSVEAMCSMAKPWLLRKTSARITDADRALHGKLLAQCRAETPHYQIGDVFRAKAGGLGKWIITSESLADGKRIYHLSNSLLGWVLAMTADEIKEQLV